MKFFTRRALGLLLTGAWAMGSACPNALAASAEDLKERPVQVVPATRPPAKKAAAKKKRPPRFPRTPGSGPPVPDIAPQRPSMSPMELSPLVIDYTLHMTQIMQQLQAQVAEAKTIGEPVRLNCLLDKFFQAQNHKNSADRAVNRFNAALVEKNDDGGFRHFGDLAAAHQAVEHFAELAATCAVSPTAQSLTAKETGSDAEAPSEPMMPTVPTMTPQYPVPERPPNASPFI